MIKNDKAINPPESVRNPRLMADTGASLDKGCGECEAKCPQHIKISDWMAQVHEEMTDR